MNPLEKRKDLMSEAIMDSITLLMIGRRLIGLLLQGSVFAPSLCRAVIFADFGNVFKVDVGQGLVTKTQNWQFVFISEMNCNIPSSVPSNLGNLHLSKWCV